MKTYQPGIMGIAEGSALVFSTTFSRTFLSGPTVYVQKFEESTWLAILVVGLVTGGFLWLWLQAYRRLPDDFYGMTEKTLGRWPANLVALFYAIAFFATAVSFVRQYAENTISTALPEVDIEILSGWYTLMAAVLIYFSLEGIARATYLVLPYAIFGVMLVLGLLFPFYNVYYLLPWQGAGVEKIISEGLLTGGINVGAAVILLFAPCFQNTRTLRAIIYYGFGGALLLRIITSLVYELVFGVNAGKEKLLPFYELARLVYINRYVQRIEAVFILLWVIGGILAISISLYVSVYMLARIFRLPAITPLVPLVSLIVFHLALLPEDINQMLMIDSQMLNYFSIGVYLIPGLVSLAVLLRKRRRKTCASG